MGTEHGYCRKEGEIAEIQTKVMRMEKVLFDGNGGDPFVVSIPKLSQNVETLNNQTIPALQKGMSSFLKYQQAQEGKQAGKAEAKRSTRWMIGILITVIVCLIGGIITLIVMVGGAG